MRYFSSLVMQVTFQVLNSYLGLEAAILDGPDETTRLSSQNSLLGRRGLGFDCVSRCDR